MIFSMVAYLRGRGEPSMRNSNPLIEYLPFYDSVIDYLIARRLMVFESYMKHVENFIIY